MKELKSLTDIESAENLIKIIRANIYRLKENLNDLQFSEEEKEQLMNYLEEEKESLDFILNKYPELIID